MAYFKYPVLNEEGDQNKGFKIPAVAIDIPFILAEKQARKIQGRGVIVDSEDPRIIEYFNEFMRVNRLHEQFITLEEMSSLLNLRL